MKMAQIALVEYPDFGRGDNSKVTVPKDIIKKGSTGAYLNFLYVKETVDIKTLIAMSNKMKGSKFDNYIISKLLNVTHPLIQKLPTLPQDTEQAPLAISSELIVFRNLLSDFNRSLDIFNKISDNFCEYHFVKMQTENLQNCYRDMAFEIMTKNKAEDSTYLKLKRTKRCLRDARNGFYNIYREYQDQAMRLRETANLLLDREFYFEDLSHEQFMSDDNHDYSFEYWSSELSESSGDLPEYESHEGLSFTDEYISYYGELDENDCFGIWTDDDYESSDWHTDMASCFKISESEYLIVKEL
jgi:hypothetical protein